MVSRSDFAAHVIDMRDDSSLQWIKVEDNASLSLIIRRFIKRGWFFIYKQRFKDHYLIISSAIDLQKDLPAKAKWELNS